MHRSANENGDGLAGQVLGLVLLLVIAASATAALVALGLA